MTLKEVTHTRSAWQGESSGLLASPSQKSAEWSLSGRSEAGAAVSRKTWWILAAASVAMIVSLGSLVPTSNTPSQISSSSTLLRSEEEDLYDELDLEMEGSTRNWAPPKAEKRCEWVVSIFTERYSTVPRKKLIAQYAKQSEDFNVFYRATAEIFWRDFALSPWGNLTLEDVGIKPEMNGVPFGEKALWTWVTGDQHLSNFGAWRNRNNEIVYGVNDFDEAAVYDFHIDVIRVAVSIYNHALRNELSDKHVKQAVYAFLGTYLDTVIEYVGNDRALVYEITPKNAFGPLQSFLSDVREDNSFDQQLGKFTVVDKKTGVRTLLKNNDTRLVKINSDLEGKIRAAFTSQQYGATMMKMGYKVRAWDDKFYEVLDVARRVGSGVGSYGVARFYVLLNGGSHEKHGSEIVLDVKYEPEGAVSKVLSDDDRAWYAILFPNPAARAIEGQRRLTSYTDPFTGWILIDGKALLVRQRSPWKDAPNLDHLRDADDFTQFMEQVAVATATSHTRGTLSKSPGQFKHMLTAAMQEYRHRKAWRKAVTNLAQNYHNQVLLDFECFREYVKQHYAS